jgi:hypothetical protein
MHPGSVGANLAEKAFGSILNLSALPGEYTRLGFSPFVVVALATVVFIFPRSKNRSTVDVRMTAAAWATAICALFVINFFNKFSLWHLVYLIFPGASALNVVSLMLFMLVFPLSCIIAYTADRVNARGVILIIWSFAFLCLEINIPYIDLKRQEQLALFRVPRPPSECFSFYVDPLNEQMNLQEGQNYYEAIYPHNVAAIYIAQFAGIPTINGMASMNPPDWNFAYPGKPDYLQRIHQYIEKYKLINVCRLNIETKTWSR